MSETVQNTTKVTAVHRRYEIAYALSPRTTLKGHTNELKVDLVCYASVFRLN